MRHAAIAALLLIVVCAGGVWLTRDESVAAPTPAPAPAPARVDDAPRMVVAQPAPGVQMEPSVKRDSPSAREEAAPMMPVQPAEVMPSPFDSSDSAELRYAEAMLFAPDAGADAFLAAGEVYERCLRANPANQWCALGLVTAQRALKNGAPGPNPFAHDVPELRMPVKHGVDRLSPESRPAPDRAH